MSVDDEESEIPIFRTWRTIYAAVIVTAVLSIALVWAFSTWPF